MSSTRDLDEQLAELDIEDEKNEELVFGEDIEEVHKYDLCLVGQFLSEKTINSRAMKNKLADVWKPAMGINIKDIGIGVYLFQFYHKEDLQWVLNGGPWSFDNIMLVLDIVPPGEDPAKVSLFFLNFWIQIHDLPSSFMKETVGRQLRNFFGEFIMYDHKNETSLWRECMRIKVKIDVRNPLKRKKKIICMNGKDFVVQCKYEKLRDFCFVCGMVSHTERFCRKFLNSRGDEVNKE